MKKLFFMAIFAMLAGVAVAQEEQFMRVAKTDGTIADYAVSEIDSIFFVSKTVHEIPEHNGHAYVDLGLPSGVLWATCNVGSAVPQGYGYYYAWGEVVPKTSYNWSTYHWCDGSSDKLNKYCTKNTSGYQDNKTNLDLEDDAARVNWGGNWRIPTAAEHKELINNCTWKYTTLNGVKGFEVKSKTNDNSIFLPAAGCKTNSDLLNEQKTGHYWSSTLNELKPIQTHYLGFTTSNAYWDYYNRCSGLCIRAVCKITE